MKRLTIRRKLARWKKAFMQSNGYGNDLEEALYESYFNARRQCTRYRRYWLDLQK